MNDIDNELEVSYKEKVGWLTLMHDILARKVLSNADAAESILRTIMQKPDLQVKHSGVQADLKNLWGRSIILDCVATDSDGTVYNIEIQQDTAGASPYRARYHAGLLDMYHLRERQDFDKLPESVIIFITRNDVLGDDLPIYHIERKIDENGKSFGDKAHIIYATASYRGDDALGRLMHDLCCTNPDDMYDTTLARRVSYFKKEEGVTVMCSELERIKDEGRAEGIIEGRQKGACATALKLAQSTEFSIAQIADLVSVDEETVTQWLAEAGIDR